MNSKIYGPIPSRRLGKSLGISPIPNKTCNYGCVYCMLDKTTNMVNTPQMFYPVKEIVDELKQVIDQGVDYDVISIVGDGEPTLYAGLSELIDEIRGISDKPIALISNGATLDQQDIFNACLKTDIFLPSVNGYDLKTFKKINRPHKDIDFDSITQALVTFSKEYTGELYLELMLIHQLNDSTEDLIRYKEFYTQFNYDRLYINTPIRVPTEDYVLPVTHNKMIEAMTLLGGVGIEDVTTNTFVSTISDNIQAILSLIARHPMNQHEIRSFLHYRKCTDIDQVFDTLNNDQTIHKKMYRGYITYRT